MSRAALVEEANFNAKCLAKNERKQRHMNGEEEECSEDEKDLQACGQYKSRSLLHEVWWQHNELEKIEKKDIHGYEAQHE